MTAEMSFKYGNNDDEVIKYLENWVKLENDKNKKNKILF